MLYKLVLSTLICFYITTLPAQTNWQSATITTVTGEELTGQVDDQRWSFSVRNLRFRKSEDGQPERYPLSSISAFMVDGRRYIVEDIVINVSPRDPRKLVMQEKKQVEKNRIPMLTLVEGPLSLYEFIDEESNRHYFISENGEAPIYLDFGRYKMAPRNGKTIYRESNPFRGILLQMMSDCFRIRPEVSKVPYQKKELVDLFENYYLCEQSAPSYTLQREKGVWQFGLSVGLITSNPTYGEVEAPAFTFRDNRSKDPAFGAHVKYRFGGEHGNVAIQFGVQYHSFSISESAPDLKEEDLSLNSSFQYNYNERSIHFQLGPEVVLVRSKYPIFLETMAEYHRILDYQESRFNRQTINGEEVLDGLFYDFSDQGAFSLSAGVGVIIGKARISLRGTATRRKYETYLLNLYRLGVIGSYDF